MCLLQRLLWRHGSGLLKGALENLTLCLVQAILADDVKILYTEVLNDEINHVRPSFLYTTPSAMCTAYHCPCSPHMSHVSLSQRAPG